MIRCYIYHVPDVNHKVAINQSIIIRKWVIKSIVYHNQTELYFFVKTHLLNTKGQVQKIHEITGGHPKVSVSQLGRVTRGLGVVVGGVGLVGDTHFLGKKSMHDPSAIMITSGMPLMMASLNVIRGMIEPKYLSNVTLLFILGWLFFGLIGAGWSVAGFFFSGNSFCPHSSSFCSSPSTEEEEPYIQVMSV